MTDKKIFARYLKDAKERLGLNHSKFADLIGHSRDSYLKWYQAVNYPCPEKKERIERRIKEALK